MRENEFNIVQIVDGHYLKHYDRDRNNGFESLIKIDKTIIKSFVAKFSIYFHPWTFMFVIPVSRMFLL